MPKNTRNKSIFLPLDVNITELLTSEEVAVLQNDVLCVPDDNTQLVSAQTHLSLNDRIPKQRRQTTFITFLVSLTLLVFEVKCPLEVLDVAGPLETCLPTSGPDPTCTCTQM